MEDYLDGCLLTALKFSGDTSTLKKHSVTLAFRSSMPVEVRFPISQHSYIRAYVAPRVEETDCEENQYAKAKAVARILTCCFRPVLWRTARPEGPRQEPRWGY